MTAHSALGPHEAERSALRIGFIGAGRLANTLAPALARAGYQVAAVASHGLESARSLARRIPGCHAIDSPQGVVHAADLVFLAVPDVAIAEVAAAIDWQAECAALVHCSGAFGLELLATAAQRGVVTGSFHPLQTFAYGDATLDGVSVAIEAGGRLLAVLEEMAHALGCRPIRLPDGAKPLYHASGTIASNFLVTLLHEAARLWVPFGCSEPEALEALLPLVKTTIKNVERGGSLRALTGPIARGDTATVQRHIEALQTAAPDLAHLYRELGRRTVPLANLSRERAAQLEAILEAEEKQPCA